LRIFVLMALAGLSACAWFSRKAPMPDPTQIIVTGAPAGSILFIDGVQPGQAAALNDVPQVVNVAAGDHKVEIHFGDTVVYREETYVGPGEHRIVRVLSGLNR
jgi:hypothetical protein